MLNSDQFEEHIEMVPTHEVARFADPRTKEIYGKRAEQGGMEELAGSIRKEGVRSPLVIGVSETSVGEQAHRGMLMEGNHRLAVAVAEGISHLPVRVQAFQQGVVNWGPKVTYRGGAQNMRPSEVGIGESHA